MTLPNRPWLVEIDGDLWVETGSGNRVQVTRGSDPLLHPIGIDATPTPIASTGRYGWICPSCYVVNAPFIPQCHCKKEQGNA